MFLSRQQLANFALWNNILQTFVMAISIKIKRTLSCWLISENKQQNLEDNIIAAKVKSKMKNLP